LCFVETHTKMTTQQLKEWYFENLKEWDAYNDEFSEEDAVSIYSYDDFVDYLSIDEDIDFKELLWDMYYNTAEIAIVYESNGKFVYLDDIEQIHEELKDNRNEFCKKYQFWENDKNNDKCYIILNHIENIY